MSHSKDCIFKTKCMQKKGDNKITELIISRESKEEESSYNKWEYHAKMDMLETTTMVLTWYRQENGNG